MDSILDDNFLVSFLLTIADIYKFRIPSMSIRLKWQKSTRICDCARTIWRIIIFDHYYICYDAYRSAQTYDIVIHTRIAKIPLNYDKCFDDGVMRKNAVLFQHFLVSFFLQPFLEWNEPFHLEDLRFIFSPRI